MTGYFGGSENQTSSVVNFDYTHFLCESSREHWTFFQAMRVQVARWRRRNTSVISDEGCRFPSEAFTVEVSHSLSSLYSDVSNLITLIEEAKKQHIEALNIMLPYALDANELEKIRRKTQVEIVQFQEERDILQVTL
ncbi:hypothetical protein A1OQ_01795 [Enterovibrio norvegicus FF-162]|uniref:Uncharacterized protein n=1 Tax=Enterovibrio norvegicus FF-454 TaxID=1185651 RepID=A0A1E5BXT8_9GAMM|nr:hypothetical protein [Enterovibrio norvegicus]OEE58114.1 hypothetical protein A1OK_16240 [Enterovibrio norvegicus FF-454]OEE89554.1 hypothetical protein A1OQ_01795 [Enterovibrio norvegicus FF-162]